MGTIKKIQYNCRHATLLIEKRQEKPLTLKERVHLAIHLAGCSVCRLYLRQSRVIGRALQHLFGRSGERGYTLDEQVKQEMQKKINERL